MTQTHALFPPRQTDAHQRLSQFVAQAGTAYASGRNYDFGSPEKNHVSALSPYVRLRILDEITIARAVLDAHSEKQADKFLTEVFWRTYWKGWMELRPAVWGGYIHDINRLRDDIQTQSGLRKRWEAACLGETGIAPFDHWAHELVNTNYLHNHTRMWFASIWIFTLGLPWQLGADFFLRHLLDGDAAVNTLSWRWVAGIQTRGKTYLARPGNIAKYTGDRFAEVAGLATTAPPQEAPNPSAPRALPPVTPAPAAGRYAHLLHEDDVDRAPLLSHGPGPAAHGYLDATAGHSPWHMAPAIAAFRRAAAHDSAGAPLATLTTAKALRDWARDNALDQIVTPYAPVGPTQQMLAEYVRLPGAVTLSIIRRPLDETAWPLATKGFFPFRKHIPALISEFVRGQGTLFS